MHPVRGRPPRRDVQPRARSRPAGAATEDDLDRIASFFGEGIAWAVALAPQAEPPELPAWLERRGYASGYGWTKFTRPAGNAPAAATELRVERVDDADAFAQAFVRGYWAPEFFRDWVARLPGRPGWHAERDPRRARGAASEAGCEAVATETGEPRNGGPGSWRNISRAGFEPQHVRPNYVSAPDADTSGTR